MAESPGTHQEEGTIPQALLPLIADGATRISDLISVVCENGQWIYFCGAQPLFQHPENERLAFQMLTAQLICVGACRQVDIVRAFGVSKNSVIRSVNKYRAGGVKAFYTPRATRGATVMTLEVTAQAQQLLGVGWSRREVAEHLGLIVPKKMKRMERRSHAHAMDESPVWRISHGQATCQRRTLATHRTALASTQASSLPVPRCKPLDYRKVLTGIIFVLKTGIPWEQLPQEMGCGCGMTCLNYLNAWQRAGVWEKLHQILLAELEQADKLDWSRAAVDSAKARALGGGDQTGPNPTDRGKPGTKHHVLTEGQGVPLVTHSTGANVPDVNELLPLVDDIPPVRRKADRPRRVPDNLYADRAYDSQPHRQELERGGLIPTCARRRTEHGSGLGVYRWVAERTLSWLHSFRRLRLRTDREGPVHDAFVSLASALICMWFL